MTSAFPLKEGKGWLIRAIEEVPPNFISEKGTFSLRNRRLLDSRDLLSLLQCAYKGLTMCDISESPKHPSRIAAYVHTYNMSKRILSAMATMDLSLVCPPFSAFSSSSLSSTGLSFILCAKSLIHYSDRWPARPTASSHRRRRSHPLHTKQRRLLLFCPHTTTVVTSFLPLPSLYPGWKRLRPEREREHWIRNAAVEKEKEEKRQKIEIKC